MQLDLLKAKFRHIIEPPVKLDGGSIHDDFYVNRKAYYQKALEIKQIKCYSESVTFTGAFFANAVTICELVDKENNVLATGYAFCTQQYDRKLGNKIAEGRARKALNG